MPGFFIAGCLPSGQTNIIVMKVNHLYFTLFKVNSESRALELVNYFASEGDALEWAKANPEGLEYGHTVMPVHMVEDVEIKIISTKPMAAIVPPQAAMLQQGTDQDRTAQAPGPVKPWYKP